MAGYTRQQVQQIITDTSLKYGVSPVVSLSIAAEETGGTFDPLAKGDYIKGTNIPTSFGVFQLHRGGQAGNIPTAQLYDPVINSEVGISNLRGAFAAGVNQGLKGFSLVRYVANNAGHPGNAGVNGGPDYTAYDAKLLTAYNQVVGKTPWGSLPAQTFAPSGVSGGGSVTYDNGRIAFLSQLDDKLAVKGGLWGAILHGGQDASAISLRIVLVEIGILLLIFGLIKAIGASNITNAATTAAAVVK